MSRKVRKMNVNLRQRVQLARISSGMGPVLNRLVHNRLKRCVSKILACDSTSNHALRCLKSIPVGMDDDLSAAESRRRCRVIRSTEFIVVDDGMSVVDIPDFDAEQISTATAVNLTINGRHLKAKVPGPVDGSCSVVLGTCSRNDQPDVLVTVEIQVTGFELELGFGRWACLFLFDTWRRNRNWLCPSDRSPSPSSK